MRTYLLRGANVSLTLPSLEDFQDLSLWNDPEYRCYGATPDAVITMSAEERYKNVMKEWHRRNYFSIVENSSERFLGFLALPAFMDIYELQISLLRGRERGYGIEAVKLGLVWAFIIKGAPTVVLFVASFNKRAVHVYEKAGFRACCTLPNALRSGGRHRDMVLMLARREDWVREHLTFVKETLERSGYPLDVLIQWHAPQ